MYLLRPCVWQKISAFRLSRYFDIVRLSTVETSPVQDPCFRMSENFAKLTDIPEIYRNFRNMSKLSKMIKNFENRRSPSKGYTATSYTESGQNTKSCFSWLLSVLGRFCKPQGFANDYFLTGVSNSSFGKIFGKFRETFRHSKTGVLYRTCFEVQKSEKSEIPGKPKVQNFVPNAWPYSTPTSGKSWNGAFENPKMSGRVVEVSHLVVVVDLRVVVVKFMVFDE